MAADTIDPTSRRILQILAADGRASYQAIADAVGLSRPAVMERVKRLEETGYILGYSARLDRSKIGYPVTAFIAVRYPTNLRETRPRVQVLADNPSVLECHHVAGEDCYVLKVAAPSLVELERIIHQLRGPGEPVSTRTTIVLSSVFEKSGIVPAGEGSEHGGTPRARAHRLPARVRGLGLYLPRHPHRRGRSAALPLCGRTIPRGRTSARRRRPRDRGTTPPLGA